MRNVFGLQSMKLFNRPEKIVIHHLGKAGEAFLALPMATVLRTVYPEAHIEWVILDRYRASIGENKFINSISEVDSSTARSLADIGNIFINYYKKKLPNKSVIKDGSIWHCNAYYNYIVKTEEGGRQAPHEIPFYRQFFQNLPFCNHQWFPPTWTAEQKSIDDGEKFLKEYGISDDQMVIVVSPYVSDKTIPLCGCGESEIDWHLITHQLRVLNLPIVFTGTQFDEKFIPTGCIDGYAPNLSLGGLFYILQTRTRLTVCGNTGIGFAALFLKSDLLMYDNRKTWTEHTHNYTNKDLHRKGDFWPMFDISKMKDEMVDWESKWIQARFRKDRVEKDIMYFFADVRTDREVEVKTHNKYPENLYFFAKKLLNVRGHKYIKIPNTVPIYKITVLVSLFKASKYLISRISNLLEQTESNIELIVIDANSPEDDGTIVWDSFGNDPRLSVIRLNSRVPLYVAWNVGLIFSKGKYVTNANADDLLHPTALETMASWLDDNPEFHLVAGSWYEVKGPHNRWPAPQNAVISENKAPGHFPMWRRDLHCDIGLFDDAYKIVGDIEWWLRLIANHKKIAKSAQPMGVYHDHGSNLFHSEKDRRLQEIEMSGWPLYHRHLYETTSSVVFPELPLHNISTSSRKEGDDLTGFRDRHLGQRCFVMGDNSSLDHTDLSRLDGEVVFGCNTCYLLFDRISWRTRYYGCVDPRMLPEISAQIVRMHEQHPSMTLFLPSKLYIDGGRGTVRDTQQYIPKAANRFYFNHVRPSDTRLPWSAFSTDIDNHVVMSHAVSITLLQLAVYMGFKEIYLIGCSISYNVLDAVTQEATGYAGHEKLHFTSAGDNETDNFDRYHCDAERIRHNPDIEEVIKHYGWAKRAINACGIGVYDATVGGNFGLFPRTNFDDLFKNKIEVQ